MIKKFVSVIVALAILTACTPTKPKQDPAETLAKFEEVISKYNQITSSMTYEDVVKVMGIEGEEPSNKVMGVSGEEPSTLAEMAPGHFWNFYPDGFNVHVTLHDDGTVFIKGFNWRDETIKPKMNGRTTTEKFDKVNKGMTYAEVVSILGSPGVLKTSRITYSLSDMSKFEVITWWPEDEPENSSLHIMMVSFWDGVVADKS
jgi:hypothetical protein